MHNTSLLEILRTFTHEEIKRFEDFVSSPYHNKKSAVTNLYKHIKKYSPEFKSARLERRKIWNALYHEKEFHYGVLKNLIFVLTHLAEKFLTFEYYQRESYHLLYNLIDSINEKEIKNLFKSKFQVLEKCIENSYKNKNDAAESYYYIMSKMYLLKFGFSNQFDRHTQIGEEFDKHTIFNASLFLHSIFRNSINAINFSRDYIYNKDENIMVSFVKKADSNNLITELIESIRPESIEIFNVLNVYHKYYKSVSDNTSKEKYFDFKEALNLNAPNFSKPDRYILYSGLRNALAKLISYEMNKSKETLDIVKLKIKDEVMLNPDGVVVDSEFVSCIPAACDLNDARFIEDFTERFIKYLPHTARENIRRYSLAHLYFTKKEFEKSLEMIMTINYDLFIMKYYLKNLQMMNYYELNDHNSFLLSLDTYKHFLNNNKSITEIWKKEQISFNCFLNKLFKLKEKFIGFELKNLKNEISLSLVSRKQWLLRKIEELENKVRVNLFFIILGLSN